MVIMFIAGWIAGVIGTLMFGKWYADRHKVQLDDATARKIMEACMADEEKDHDERT